MYTASIASTTITGLFDFAVIPSLCISRVIGSLLTWALIGFLVARRVAIKFSCLSLRRRGEVYLAQHQNLVGSSRARCPDYTWRCTC